MTHQPTLDALAAARYWLEAHPDLPTPVVTIDAHHTAFPAVTIAWHMTGGLGTHAEALDVLRAFADWPWQMTTPTPSLAVYKLVNERIQLVVYTDAHAATPASPVNLLDALAEVA